MVLKSPAKPLKAATPPRLARTDFIAPAPWMAFAAATLPKIVACWPGVLAARSIVRDSPWVSSSPAASSLWLMPIDRKSNAAPEVVGQRAAGHTSYAREPLGYAFHADTGAIGCLGQARVVGGRDAQLSGVLLQRDRVPC